MNPRELLKILEDNGWFVDRVRGSHYILKHPTKPGRPVVPMHNNDLKSETYNNILHQAGLK